MSNHSIQNTQFQTTDNSELSLIDIWLVMWRRKWIILTLGPVAGLIGVYIALTATVYYQSKVLAVPAQTESDGGGISALAGQFGGLASMAGINLGGGGNTETALATLKSRTFLLSYIKEKSLVKVLFNEDWDEESQQWLISNERRGENGHPTDGEVYQRFSEEVIGVSQDKKTNLVTVSITWIDPEQCQEWANELITRLNKHMREKAKAETEKNLTFLNQQLEKIQLIEVRESLYSIIENESKNAMLANAKEEFVLEIIDPASLPEVQYKPSKKIIVAAAGLLGGFLGIFICFLLHFVEATKRREL